VGRDEVGGVLEYLDVAVQLAKHSVGDVARGVGLAVQEDRNVGVLEADLVDEARQPRNRVPCLLDLFRTLRRRLTG
jgi:hypothetical protein